MGRFTTRAVLAALAVTIALTSCTSSTDSSDPRHGRELSRGPASADPASAHRSQPAESGAGVPRGWTMVTDAPSGVSLALPGGAQTTEEHAVAASGEPVTIRNYTAVDGEYAAGFNVLDSSGAGYDIHAATDGVASTIGGTVEDTTEIEVDGHDAVQAEISYGDGDVAIFQLIMLDQHVVQPLVSGPSHERAEIEAYLDQLVDSAVLA